MLRLPLILLALFVCTLVPGIAAANTDGLHTVARACDRDHSGTPQCDRSVRRMLHGAGAAGPWLRGLVSRERRLVRRAISLVGTPYQYGGETTGGVDCSGFIYLSYEAIGRRMPRSTYQLILGGRAVPPRMARVGDILLYGSGAQPGHAGLYLGHGWMLHSPQSGERVRFERIANPRFADRLLAVRRYLPVPRPRGSAAPARTALLGSLAPFVSMAHHPLRARLQHLPSPST